jgi:hypothetical protein
MNLEDRLRHRLRRVDPEPDFAARVLARLDAPARSSMSRWALAASLVLAIGAGAIVQHERSQGRAAAAGRDLAVALELTSRQLEHVHQRLHPRIEETGS